MRFNIGLGSYLSTSPFFQDELDLSAANKQAMMSLPDEKKWQLYCSQKNRAGIGDGSGAGPGGGPGGPGYDDPETYVEAVRMFASGLLIHQPEEDKKNSRFGNMKKIIAMV